jgi:glycosyltransferase involved in cell wall biosynthesis
MDLVEAVRIARERDGLPLRLRLLGGGTLRAELTDLAASVSWLEVRPGVLTPEVATFLHDLDLFVLPSRVLPDHEEHDAHALLEAQAVGLPVIGARSGIIPELLGDGSGLLVAPQDPAALAEAIAILARDPVLRADVARRGHEKARGEYLLEPVAREHAAIYKRLVA